jgi:hypothetical protein
MGCIFLTLFVVSFRCPSVEVNLTGHLRSKSHKNVGGLTVFVKGAIKNGLGITTTDKNGDFGLNFDDCYDCKRTLLFYCVNNGNDTVLLKRVIKLESDAPEMTFWIK